MEAADGEGTVIVCHCWVVNHRDIEAAVESGARTVPDVSSVCGAGSHCGGCVPAIADTIADALERELGPVPETPCAIRTRAGAAA